MYLLQGNPCIIIKLCKYPGGDNMTLENMLTIKEAVAYIEEHTGKEFKERKLMYLIRREKVEAHKVGWVWTLPKEEVERLVTEYSK